MTGEFIVGGIYLSPLVPACAIALLLTALLSVVLVRLRFYRLVWHRPLVEVSIFVMLLAAASLLGPWSRAA